MTTTPFLTSSGKDRMLVYSVRRMGDDIKCVIVGADLKAAGNSLDNVWHCSSPRGVRSGSLCTHKLLSDSSYGLIL